MTSCIDKQAPDCPLPHTARTLAAGLALLVAACASTPPQQPVEEPQATTTPGISAAAAQQKFDAALQLMKEHQDSQALAAFTQLAHDVPDASGPFTNLGILHARAQQWGPAQQAFLAAVKHNPRNAVAWNWLGIAERNLGHYPQAAAAYEKALAARPDYADAHFNLAVLYDTQLHDAGRAISEYQAYQRTSGTDAAIVTAWIKGLQTALPRNAGAGTDTTTTLDQP